MLLSHTPTGAAAPDLIFCARLPAGQQHLLATRLGESLACPSPCGMTCPLQRGACVAPPPLPHQLVLSLQLTITLTQLLEEGLNKPAGCFISRN
jgi:hypothetical protein